MALPDPAPRVAADAAPVDPAEAALRASEVRFRAMIENSYDVVILVNAEGRILFASPSVTRMLGYSLEEFVGRRGAEFVHPDDQGITTTELARLRVRPGESVMLENRLRHKDGSWRWAQNVGTNLLDNPAVGAIVVNFRDITDRKAAEQALKEADRRKDEFLAMLAHELRNPLAPIRNAVELLKFLGAPHADLAAVHAMIERQVTHLAHLVDDLLDVSRISRGKILLRKQPLDLVALVCAAIDDHRPLLRDAGLSLTVQLPDRPLWMTGDPTRLAQVADNLLHNAGKFTDAGGRVTVQFTEQAAAAPGAAPWAVLTVRDTGIGLSADIVGRLFEPFSQADSSLDRSRGGLGLGLALVKGLAQLHGGSVQASSPGLGRGAEFTVRLPLHVANAAVPVAPAVAPRALDERQYPARKVLIIEDNRDAAESTRMLLRFAGHDVSVAFTGAAGLAAAQRSRPDVVLCDLGLPGGLDGFAVARAMRADPALAGIALIALSGYGQDEDKRRAAEAGFGHHLTKPVDPHRLTGLLDTLPGS
jgi:PAS domain S-box-containing protein